MRPGWPRKQFSHAVSVLGTRFPVARTKISIPHSRQNPIVSRIMETKPELGRRAGAVFEPRYEGEGMARLSYFAIPPLRGLQHLSQGATRINSFERRFERRAVGSTILTLTRWPNAST